MFCLRVEGLLKIWDSLHGWLVLDELMIYTYCDYDNSQTLVIMMACALMPGNLRFSKAPQIPLSHKWWILSCKAQPQWKMNGKYIADWLFNGTQCHPVISNNAVFHVFHCLFYYFFVCMPYSSGLQEIILWVNFYVCNNLKAPWSNLNKFN